MKYLMVRLLTLMLHQWFQTLVSTDQPDFVINCIGAIKPLIEESDTNLLLMHKVKFFSTFKYC